MVTQIHSWGRVPTVEHKATKRLYWRDELPDLSLIDGNMLAYGLGRSYGDSCLNESGTLILTDGLHRFISINEEQGLIRCEAGVSFDEILSVIIPLGFFLPVTPGTRMITVGGAIANDVHGKNHHISGTFGCHVTQFELLRSDGSRTICSEELNSGLYRATIGGLGLTGIILWAEFRIIRIPSPFIAQENIVFSHVDEYLEHSRETDKKFNYVVSWIDASSAGGSLGRGIFMGGNFVEPFAQSLPRLSKKSMITLPFNVPDFFLNKFAVKAFNSFYFHMHRLKRLKFLQHYAPFFYPLDSILQWNRLYGRRGFYQYQFVVPHAVAKDVLHEVLQSTAASGKASFLSVLKNFGPKESPGMLSFPRAGVTLSLDFKNEGTSSLALMSRLDRIIDASGSRLYPAKDARMTKEHFQHAYPNWQQFREYIDPKFSSSFWRRVSQ